MFKLVNPSRLLIRIFSFHWPSARGCCSLNISIEHKDAYRLARRKAGRIEEKTFWNSSKKKRAAISEKYRFDNLLSVAKEMPVSALPDLIRAIVRPLQSDFLLAVAEEGIDARPHMTPAEFFFKGIGKLQDYEKMKAHELPAADDHALSLASDVVLPWPWSRRRYIDNILYIGTHKEMPWKQDKINHHVDLWLPWRIGCKRIGYKR